MESQNLKFDFQKNIFYGVEPTIPKIRYVNKDGKTHEFDLSEINLPEDKEYTFNLTLPEEKKRLKNL